MGRLIQFEGKVGFASGFEMEHFKKGGGESKMTDFCPEQLKEWNIVY